MANQRKHKSKSHRGGRFWGIYVFFTALLVAAAIVAGCIVFFKVNCVEVYIRDSVGNIASLRADDHYTKEEIIDAAGIHIGDNLFLLNKNRAVINLLNRMPYISSVSIRKSMPDTLVLTLTEGEAVGAIQSEEGWWLMDVNGKLLEEVQDCGNATVITGLTLIDPLPGQIIEVPDGSDEEVPSQQMQKDSLLQVLPPLEDYDLQKDVKSIDLTSESELVMDYDGRIQVKIPLESDFDYKIKYFAKILTEYVPENWTEKDTGTLDMTYDDGHPHLAKNS